MSNACTPILVGIASPVMKIIRDYVAHHNTSCYAHMLDYVV